MGLHAMKWAFGAQIDRSGAKFVLVALAEHASDRGPDAWTCFPSIRRLMEWTSQGERTIERHLSWLIAEGWISREVRPGRRRSDSAYVYVLRREKTGDVDGEFPGDDGQKTARTTDDQGGSSRRSGGDRPPISTAPPAKLTPPYIEEPIIEPVIEPDARETADVETGFSEFWSAYPSKIEERGARIAFRRLVQRGEASIDVLIEGAKRYAVLVLGRGARYIKSPINWLRGGCWADGRPASGSPATRPSAEAANFEGPADIWRAVAERKGVAWARSYLAPCAWSGAMRALRPRTGFAARKLRDELGQLLCDLSISIDEPTATAGASHV